MSLLNFPAAQLAPAVIPYRTDAPVSMGTFALALLITLCLLGLLTAALLYVRRRGRIAWRGTTRVAVSPEEGIQVRASRRLSMGTTAHVISYRGQAYLVVESSRGTNATVTPVVPHQAIDEGTS
ncbi:hypothetical protein [Dyella flagellata]|uniref:Flagellar protein FliO/FliZ n=1 Tax=Dyella flagellata TaxID=1867833 RepID=A0ABQ5X7E7_9GAMM|nr:hypothetical protein [Dyella flagellata]GLQ86473.1 hypothetical protein GCM10007898_00390 [Dyella flagellata]